MSLYAKIYHSPIGKCLLLSDETHLRGLWFKGQKHYCPIKADVTIRENSCNAILEQTIRWLDSYFQGKEPAIDELQQKPEGTKFQQDVWDILRTIPYGKTMTYGEIAAMLAGKYGKEKCLLRQLVRQ